MALEIKDLEESIRKDLDANLQGWAIEENSNPISIVGVVQLIEAEKLIDEYRVRLQLSQKHPHQPPIVYEIGNRIERKADHHIANDGAACLFVPEEKYKYWRPDMKISDFINGPVKAYFISQSYFESTGEWIFGERRHGWDGVVDFYFERLGITDLFVLEKMLQLAAMDTIKGHWPCPCNQDVKLRKCHMEMILKIREEVDRERIVALLGEYEKAKKEARAMSNRK